jgi:hypothetical protein
MLFYSPQLALGCLRAELLHGLPWSPHDTLKMLSCLEDQLNVTPGFGWWSEAGVQSANPNGQEASIRCSAEE